MRQIVCSNMKTAIGMQMENGLLIPIKYASQALYETGAFKYGPGDVKYKDLDGNGEITYGEQTLEDHGDLKRIGNTLPNFEYGFSVALTYKDFDFSTFFQGIGSRDVWAVGQTGIPGFMPGEAVVRASDGLLDSTKIQMHSILHRLLTLG